MQLFIIPVEGGHAIIKHIIFDGGWKAPSDAIDKMCQGQAFQINFGKQVRVGSRALQHMLEKMGGFQVRYFVLQPKYAKGPSKEADAL
eukprot:10176105-Alexandrium_andersonii.AAC.1